MQFPAEFEWLSPDGVRAADRLHGQPLRRGLDAAHRAGPGGGAAARRYEQFRDAGRRSPPPERHAARRVRPRDPGPLGDRRRTGSGRRYVWPRFVTAIPREFFAAVRAEAAAPRSGAGARFWIMPQTRDMNPRLHRQGRLLRRHQAGAAGRGDRGPRGRAARDAGLAAGRAVPGRVAGQGVAAARLRRAPRRDHRHRVRPGVPGPARGLAGGVAARRRGAPRCDRFHRWPALPGPRRSTRRPADGGLAVTVVNGLAASATAWSTVTVRLGSPGTPAGWRSPTRRPAPPCRRSPRGCGRHPDGSLAEVTLTFRARGGAGARASGATRWPPSGASRAGRRRAGWTDVDGLAIENERVRGDRRPGARRRAQPRCSTSGRAGGAGRAGQRPGAAGGVPAAPALERGPLAPVAEGAGTGSARRAGRPCGRSGPPPGRGWSPRTPSATWRSPPRRCCGTARTGWSSAPACPGRSARTTCCGSGSPPPLAGGLPVYQTATAVIGRPFGAPEADVAEHWWTLDNPANQWFGIGSVARAGRSPADRRRRGRGPRGGRGRHSRCHRRTGPGPPSGICSSRWRGRASRRPARGPSGTRYGSVDVDSNLPDFRIALGGPSANAFTAEVLAAGGPAGGQAARALVAEDGAARLWVPAAQSRAAAFAPGADLRGPRDLPVLIVAPADPAGAGRGGSASWRGDARRPGGCTP